MCYSIVREQQLPTDQSNRIGKIALLWEAITAEHRFADFRPYLKYDVGQWAEKLRGED